MRLIVVCAAFACCLGCVPATQRPGPAAAAAAFNTRLLKQGYKPTLLHGQRLYCRTEMVTGTQFPNTVCHTEEEIKQQEENTRDTIHSRAMHPNSQCRKPDCSS
jgi:hypothetical protein